MSPMFMDGECLLRGMGYFSSKKEMNPHCGKKKNQTLGFSWKKSHAYISSRLPSLH